jgi:hypothetical protein
MNLFQAVVQFLQLANEADEVPKLKGKSYSAFKIDRDGWAKLELIQRSQPDFATPVNPGPVQFSVAYLSSCMSSRSLHNYAMKAKQKCI